MGDVPEFLRVFVPFTCYLMFLIRKLKNSLSLFIFLQECPGSDVQQQLNQPRLHNKTHNLHMGEIHKKPENEQQKHFNPEASKQSIHCGRLKYETCMTVLGIHTGKLVEPEPQRNGQHISGDSSLVCVALFYSFV